MTDRPNATDNFRPFGNVEIGERRMVASAWRQQNTPGRCVIVVFVNDKPREIGWDGVRQVWDFLPNEVPA